MKRVILAAVLAVAAMSAYAQSSVTIYGVADAAYTLSSNSDQTFNGVQSGSWAPSRLGFKGSEDLGNGLQAMFTLEYGTSIDTTVGGLGTTRQAFVGLNSNYGFVGLGKQKAASTDIVLNNSAFNMAAGSAYSQVLRSVATIGGTMNNGDTSRWNNAIVYQSKDYSGFSGRAIYSFGETNVNEGSSQDSKIGLGASYVNGPLNIDAVYQTTLNATALGATGKNINEYYIGGAYDFTSVKVIASYQQLVNSNSNTAAIDNKTWTLGVVVPVSAAGNVRAEYVGTSFDNNGNQPVAAQRIDGSSAGYAIGYTHNLSKRTMLYTTYANVSNDRDSLGVGANGVGLADEHTSTFTLGMNHKF